MTNKIKLFIILILLFMATLFCMRNGVELRTQRLGYLIHAMIFCGGSLVFFFRSKTAGLLILYASILAFRFGVDIQTAVILISMVGIYLALSEYDGDRKLVYDFIILLAIVNLVFQIGQAIGYNWITYAEETRSHWPGLMANRNETSALYAITAAACLRKKRYPFLVIPIAGLLLSKSLGGILAFTIMMIAWSVRNIYKRRVLRAGKYPGIKYHIPIGVIAAVLGFLLFYGTFIHPFNIEQRKQERFSIWGVTTRVAMLRPMGWGFGQYEVIIPFMTSWKYLDQRDKDILSSLVKNKTLYNKALENEKLRDPNFLTGDIQKVNPFVQAHNDYIEWFFASGYPGLILGFLFIAWSLRTAYKSVDSVPFYGIIASCITATTFFSWQIIPTAVLTVLYLAWVNSPKQETTGSPWELPNFKGLHNGR